MKSDPQSLGPDGLDSTLTALRGSGAKGGASLYGVSVEYGLHCLLWLLLKKPGRASSRDLADFQGVPPATMAKIMPRLEKARIVRSVNGIAGGYEIARPAADISVLDVIDAIEGNRRLFECREVRRGCVLFGGEPPHWAAGGVCGIHAVMLRAEAQMRAELAKTNLDDIAQGGTRPHAFETEAGRWFSSRSAARETSRLAAMRQGRRAPP
jgi:Rrf2 family protein